MWCGIVGEHLIGTYVLQENLTDGNYTNFFCKINCQLSYRIFLCEHNYWCTSSMIEQPNISTDMWCCTWMSRSLTGWLQWSTELAASYQTSLCWISHSYMKNMVFKLIMNRWDAWMTVILCCMFHGQTSQNMHPNWRWPFWIFIKLNCTLIFF